MVTGKHTKACRWLERCALAADAVATARQGVIAVAEGLGTRLR